MSEPFAVPAAARAGHDLMAEGFVCRLVGGGNNAVWVHLAGELDIATAAVLERMLAWPEQRAWLVVLDLRKLTFMDSCGARVIAGASIHARQAGRRLVLVGGPPQVQRLLALAGGADTVGIVELAGREAAIHAIRQLRARTRQMTWAEARSEGSELTVAISAAMLELYGPSMTTIARRRRPQFTGPYEGTFREPGFQGDLVASQLRDG